MDQSLDTWAKQTVKPDEIIVADDGSNPPLSTTLSVDCFRVRENGRHRGSSQAKNCGARVSTSKYLIFADAEMLHMPEAVESLLSSVKCIETSGITKFLLNVIRVDAPGLLTPEQTSDMNKVLADGRKRDWIDGQLENPDIFKLCAEQNCGLVPRKFFWDLGGYDEVGFPNWGFNNQDLLLRVLEDDGYVTSQIIRSGHTSRLICFYNHHEPPSNMSLATQEFIAKWGEPFHFSMIGTRIKSNPTYPQELHADDSAG